MKVNSGKMQPLKKKLEAYWMVEGKERPDTALGMVTLPAGTMAGYWQWRHGVNLTIMRFVGMPSPGMFNCYMVLIWE